MDFVPFLSTLKQLTNFRLRKPRDREYMTTIRKDQIKQNKTALECIKEFHLYHDIQVKQIPLMASIFPNVEHFVFQTNLNCQCKLETCTTTCANCQQKLSHKQNLSNRFKKMRSVKFLVPQSDAQVRAGRFHDKIIQLEEKKKSKPLPMNNFDDVWSSYWEEDIFSLDPIKEDNGYEQSKEDQQYIFWEDYFYSDEIEEEDMATFMKKNFPTVPHLHFNI